MPALQIDDTYIHYITNRDGANPTDAQIVYVHGTGCNGRVFENHIKNLSSHHALAIDLPGHGKSGGTGFRNVVDHAHVVAEFIRQLDCAPCVVAGHSLGGGIAIALAIYYPEVLRGLVLVDTGARLRVAPAVIEKAKRTAAGLSDAKTDSRQGFCENTSQQVVDDLRRITENESPGVTLKDWYADDSCDFLSRVPQITVPSMAICGREDQLTPVKFHEYLRDNMPNCELKVIDDAGHWPYIEQPETFDSFVGQYLHNVLGS